MVKVFSMAHSIVGVNEQQVCDPLLYLVKNKLQPTGMYKEDNPVYSTTMTVRRTPKTHLYALPLLFTFSSLFSCLRLAHLVMYVVIGVTRAVSVVMTLR